MTTREKLVFRPPETLKGIEPHTGEFTENHLSDAETEKVERLLHWNDPSELTPDIFEVFGRSIVMASPDREDSAEGNYHGQFGGLQVIGLGGALDTVKAGMRSTNITLDITPVDDTNHAEQLKEILQTRWIDRHGNFGYKDASYAPLHGMTAEAAERRKRWSSDLVNLTDLYKKSGRKPPFVLPELAAEGVLTNKHDDKGNPLAFQVYRVPLLKRLPGQIFETIGDSTVGKGFEQLMHASYAMGRVCRGLQACSISYGDAHLGNVSHIQWNDEETLYITDLGNAHDASDQKPLIQRRYTGLDMLVVATSLLELVKPIHQIFGSVDAKIFSVDNMFAQLYGTMLAGFFSPEVSQKTLSPQQVLALSEATKKYVYGQNTQIYIEKVSGMIAKYIK